MPFYSKTEDRNLDNEEDSMKSRKSLFTGLAMFAVAALLLTLSTTTNVSAAKRSPLTPDVVGAWFGIARPCPASAGTDSPVHAAFCTAVCGLCPNAGILPPEAPLTTTLKDDGQLSRMTPEK